MATTLLAGCTPHVEKVTMDPGRLEGPTGSAALPAVKLSCPFHLQEVVDARGDGDRVGGIGNRMFILDDAPGLVRRQLVAMGISEADVAGAAQVRIRILKIYLAANGVTNVPVVVYQATVDQQAPFLIRSQLASMDWAGTQNEEYAAFARAFQDANAQLGAKLAQQCSARK